VLDGSHSFDHHATVKIGILSDIHGNFDALRALPETFDEVWVLGDLVNYGPQPREVVDQVSRTAAAVVRGNHDHAVTSSEDPKWKPRLARMAETTRQFTVAALDRRQLDFLANLPTSLELTRAGVRFHLTHATPSNALRGWCLPDSDAWDAEVARISADVLLVGHTHVPFVRQVGPTLVVNPGSIGQPKTGDSFARYAVWKNGEVSLRSFTYPLDVTIGKIEALGFPQDVTEDLVALLRTGTLPEWKVLEGRE